MKFNTQNTLQDALIAHKFLIHMYCQYGIECSNQTLRELFSELEVVAREHDFKIFTFMNELGYYPITPAPNDELSETIKMHTKMQKNLETSIKG